MENRRLVLLCALGVILFFMWEAWQRDYAPAPQPQTASAPAAHDQAASNNGGSAGNTQGGEGIPVPGVAEDVKPAGPASTATASNGNFLPNGTRIHVRTDKLDAVIDTHGGGLRRVTLRGYSVSREHQGKDLNFLNDQLPYFFVAQSGLASHAGDTPTHHSVYHAERTQYDLSGGQDKLSVPLTWTGEDGRKVTKIYTFHRDSYEIDLRYVVDNGAAQPWKVSPYLQFWRTPETPVENPKFWSGFNGIALYREKDKGGDYKFHTKGYDDIESNPLQFQQTGGWIAMDQHYFIAAVIPPAKAQHRYFAKPRNIPGSGQKAYVDGYVGPEHTVAAGATGSFDTRLYIGPKLQDVLGDVAPGLGLSVDYGIWTIVAQPIFWVLSHIHGVVGNWGWSIVILTLLIKLLFYKLTETQYKSMARMKKFGPRIKQLKERYADDREGMQKAMMDLYKKEGFNPLGGCWPMAVQLPVFIALYWVLRASVELRQAPWVLWINDLSAPDPYYVLPVLYGIVIFLQQRMSGSMMTVDDMQRKVMMLMPLGMAVFFAFFPSGLVLYYIISSFINIGQQAFIMRRVEVEENAHHSKA